jgi:pyruvate dehydrogenase E1 component beta subunit
VLGEDVGVDGGVFRATEGLLQLYGESRVIDTPLAEAGIAGVSIGLAAQGFRPVAEIQFTGFAYACIDQLINHASRLRTRTRGRLTCPLVLRSPAGGGIHAPEHHSESPEAMFAHIPGLKVVAPSSPARAYGLLLSAIRDPDPVVFLYAAGLRELVEEVPDEQYLTPLDKAAVRTTGSDLTIVSSGAGMPDVLDATEKLQKAGMKVEAIDLRSLKPIDTATLVKSVQKTKRLLTFDQSYYTLCPGAEVIARVAENVDGAKFKRIAFPDAPPPAAPEMFNWMRPNADHIIAAAKKFVA